MKSSSRSPGLIAFDTSPRAVARRRWRRALKDSAAKHAIAIGGVAVIMAVLAIFFYLLSEVFPLFAPATFGSQTHYAVPGGSESKTLWLGVEEQAELAFRITDAGEVIFFRLREGIVASRQRLPLPEGVKPASVSEGTVGSGLLAVGLSDGSALLIRIAYQVSYPDDQRLIVPSVEFPLGTQALALDAKGSPLGELALRDSDDGFTLAALTADDRVVLLRIEVTENLLGEKTLETTVGELPALAATATKLALSGDRRWLFVADLERHLSLFDLGGSQGPALVDRKPIAVGAERVSALSMLLGGISVLIGTSDGRIEQWFPVRGAANGYSLARVREFHQEKAGIAHIVSEHRRKGFAAGDEAVFIAIYHATAHRQVLERRLSDSAIVAMSVAPRGNHLLAQNERGRMLSVEVDNPHPEISFSALWRKVWYESYPQPDYIWQSSAATRDFEPKFSLTPLVFGTLKAAFYAMVLAVPIALMGAVFTAYFMHPRIRQWIKPSIEVMAALPTVILGFLAGLWLAPYMESHLPGVFAVLILLPVGVVLTGFLWRLLPAALQHAVPDGWQAVILLPVIIVIGWLCFSFSLSLERALFDGDMRSWLNGLGLDFDQRNAMVVGVAMGFAVIPIIFSIAEDALFGVPKHLSLGSLALGATPWQTLVRVVIPTASPGIFSAVMIGMGRAVGETMIVLMATGNTPILDMNIFEGMRTLSANIAVEMPESEVGSTHFRLLFLTGLVLFGFTFLLNTGAEVVRSRLRKRYSAI
jgi:phosphate transport system permease protein